MPAPIDKIGTKVVAPQTEVKQGGKTRFNEVQQNAKTKDAAAAPADLPPLQQVDAAQKKTLEHDLRKRLEKANSSNPTELFGNDMKDMRKRLDTTTERVEASGKTGAMEGVRDRLSAIDAQYKAAEQKLQQLPDTNNLRGLLAMQTEMYQMSQNLEILSKVVDAATSGVKQTLQTQV
ncbi:MAG: hypothetical protein NTW28_19635 [Candidatus Solibacter sp.]|nr:hypothetical protein [Candidatus Solibacter sp.]